jgi:beta-lactamase superfamily II metal-dependent hydrolase
MPKMKKRKATVDRDELFDIICFYMGQGDCSLIRCPDGTMVMIDCGSKSDFQSDYLKIAASQVRDPDWAGNKMRIDALILTHKDADHHSQVGWVLGETTVGATKYKKLTVDKIYFSWAAADDSPLGRYTANGLNKVVYDHYFETAALYEVTIRDEDDSRNYYQTWDKADGFKKVVKDPKTGASTVPIAGRKLTLFAGTTDGGKAWSVSLIAGNVLKETKPIADLGKDEEGYPFKDTATEDNARSLITLLEIGTQKALFCGDATFSTEHFLVKSQSALIGGAQFILAPHHGSENASSIPFVNAVRARQVGVSSEYMEHAHLHPRQTALKRWLAKARASAPHALDYWEIDPSKADTTLKDWNKKGLSITGSDTFRWLTDLSTTDIYYAIKTWQGLLFRADVSLDVWETAFKIVPDDPNATGQFLNFQVG